MNKLILLVLISTVFAGDELRSAEARQDSPNYAEDSLEVMRPRSGIETAILLEAASKASIDHLNAVWAFAVLGAPEHSIKELNSIDLLKLAWNKPSDLVLIRKQCSNLQTKIIGQESAILTAINGGSSTQYDVRRSMNMAFKNSGIHVIAEARHLVEEAVKMSGPLRELDGSTLLLATNITFLQFNLNIVDQPNLSPDEQARGISTQQRIEDDVGRNIATCIAYANTFKEIRPTLVFSQMKSGDDTLRVYHLNRLDSGNGMSIEKYSSTVIRLGELDRGRLLFELESAFLK